MKGETGKTNDVFFFPVKHFFDPFSPFQLYIYKTFKMSKNLYCIRNIIQYETSFINKLTKNNNNE